VGLQSSTNHFRLDANQGTLTAQDYPGGGLAVSANGNSNGIVWAIVPTTAVVRLTGSGDPVRFGASRRKPRHAAVGEHGLLVFDQVHDSNDCEREGLRAYISFAGFGESRILA
jgi:hypothetical protein